MLIKLCNETGILNTTDYIDEYVENRTIEAMIGCSTQNVYEDYLEFLDEKGYKEKLTHIQFSKRLCFRYDLTSKVITYNGVSVRILIKK